MAEKLQPTVWRTCRVLANTIRLKMFAVVAQEPDMTVSAVATRVKLPLPVTSMYLRALEARGLLMSDRDGRWVTYRVSEANGAVTPLALALRSLARRKARFAEATFRLATAFTHPRRVDVFRSLSEQPRALAELKLATGIPERALLRHLEKLRTRGFVVYRRGRPGTYAATNQDNAVGRALAELASGGARSS
jgi:DNA-binding transcriptional ArsR family regulator